MFSGWVPIIYGVRSATKYQRTAENEPLEDFVPNQTKRGSYVPMVFGRVKIGPTILWTGGGFVVERSSSAGGKGKSGSKGGGSISENIYNESAWHALCVGPGWKLHRITEFGNTIWEGPIERDTTPSGSALQTGSGDFEIYWGEPEQPSSSFLADVFRVGVASRWSYLMYLIWRPKVLGPTPLWPQLQYEIEVLPHLTNLPSGNVFETKSLGTVNGAHVIAQLLFAKYPHGRGLDPDEWDLASLDQMRNQIGGENLDTALAIQLGEPLVSVVSDLLRDYGYMISFLNGKFTFVKIRSQPDAPLFSLSTILEELPEEQIPLYDEQHGTRVIYEFADVDRDHKVNTVTLDDDGVTVHNATPRTMKRRLRAPRTFSAASSIAERRSQEDFSSPTTYKLKMNHQAREIYPGMVFFVEGIRPQLRCLNVEFQPLSSEVIVDAIVDGYGVGQTTFTNSAPPPPPIRPDPDPDPQDSFFEIPKPEPPPGHPELEDCNPGGGVFRVRAHENIMGANIFISADDVTYRYLTADNQTTSGGTLDEALGNDTLYVVESGPLFTAVGDDITRVADLTGNDVAWKSGRQLALINGELFYLRNIEAIGGDQYRLRGLIRARAATSQESHSINDEVYIVNRDNTDFLFLQAPEIRRGETAYIKVQPFVLGQLADLATLPAISLDVGDALVKPVTALRHAVGVNFFDYGDDITLRWAYSVNDGNVTGAGYPPAGQPVGMTSSSTFRVETYTEFSPFPDGSLVKIDDDIPLPEFTLDFSTIYNPGPGYDHYFFVYHKVNGVLSTPTFIRLLKNTGGA